MLDKRDLELLRDMVGEVVEEKVNPKFEAIDRRFEAMDQRLDAMDQRFEGIDRRFEALEEKMEARIQESENLLLDELDRIQKHLSERIDKVQSEVDELNQYHRIKKLEDDNTGLILKLVENLMKRMDVLEAKIA